MKVALVYDRLNKWGGAERVLIALSEAFPDGTWYTSVWEPRIATFSEDWNVKVSWLNKIPFLRTHHEWIPYLMPFVFEGFDFRAYDLVISVSSESAKGVITRPGTIHLDYCLTPTRYLYSHKDVYLTNPIYRFVAQLLRPWDYVAAQRPDEMIAISTQVKNRIQKYYNRESAVIFPPVDIAHFQRADVQTCKREDGYYLVVSRLVPYKNLETVIAAFKQSPERQLVIVGTGTLFNDLSQNLSPNVTLVGAVAESVLLQYYAGAKGYIQANVEDFGLSMVEAQASGVPIIARRGGGASDIIQDAITGVLYDGQGAPALLSALSRFESIAWDPGKCRQNANRFDIHIWQEQLLERVQTLCKSNS